MDLWAVLKPPHFRGYEFDFVSPEAWGENAARRIGAI
jgi:hypothetical protein